MERDGYTRDYIDLYTNKGEDCSTALTRSLAVIYYLGLSSALVLIT